MLDQAATQAQAATPVQVQTQAEMQTQVIIQPAQVAMLIPVEMQTPEILHREADVKIQHQEIRQVTTAEIILEIWKMTAIIKSDYKNTKKSL